MYRAHNLGGKGGFWKLLSVLFYSSVHSSVNSSTDGLELLSACCDLYPCLVLFSLYTNAAASWTTVYTVAQILGFHQWAFTLFPLYFEEVKRPYFHRFSSGCKCQSKHVNKLKAGKENCQCLLDQTTNINFRKNVTLYQAKPSQAKVRWEHSHQALDSYTHQTN